jgi:hypothetical protein
MASTETNHELPMRLFSPDLFRNFGIGFVLGALLIAGANAESWGGALAPAAQAAEMRQTSPVADDVAAEFVIAP